MPVCTNPSFYLWWLRWQRICLQCRRPGFDPWVGKIPWKRKWWFTPIFLPEKVPWTEEPGRLQSMGLQRVRDELATKQQVSKCYQILRSWDSRKHLQGLIDSYQSIGWVNVLHQDCHSDWMLTYSLALRGGGIDKIKLKRSFQELSCLAVLSWGKKFTERFGL